MARSNLESLLFNRQAEAALERRVQMFCNAKSVLFYKFVSPAHKGVPDRIICARGKVLFLEFKSAGGELSKKQQYEIEKLRAAGMQAYWSNNYDHIIRLLTDYFELDGAKKVAPAPEKLLSPDVLERFNALYHNPGGR